MELNQIRLAKAIAVMQRVVDRGSQLRMDNWQTPPDDEDHEQICIDEMEMHQCGTAACFGGWLAVSPEWKEDGGTLDPSGGPVLERGIFNIFGSDAIAKWLGIPTWLAQNITCTAIAPTARSDYYGKLVTRITAEDVLTKLKTLQLQ